MNVLYSFSDLPMMVKAKQQLVSRPIADIKEVLSAQLGKLKLDKTLKPGDTVALTGGSRGITNIDRILRHTIDYLKHLGARPFIVPAMGSHGGATAEGQVQILSQLGITEKTMGVPVKATMEVQEIGTTAAEGTRVFMDRHAWQADFILPVNRIKPHTKFKGALESGLCKMMNIGLGKYDGAQYYHHCALAFGFPEILESVSRVILRKKKVLCGLAIVEDGYDQTALLEAIPAADIIRREKELLVLSKKYIPRLPFHDIDFLVVDWMGKEISGAGMDSNVTGRNRDIMKKWHSDQKIKRLFVRDLTPASAGNGIGIGCADFTTERLVNKLDLKKTIINGLSTCYPEVIMTPPYFKTDREALEACMNTIGLYDPKTLNIIWIRDTAHLDTICISQALAGRAAKRDDMEIEGQPFSFALDRSGDLISPL